MAKVLQLVFSLLFVIEGSMSINGTLESTPLSVNGLLTACAGQQISLTCSHNNLNGGTTIWKGGPPLNCSSGIGHGFASPSPDPCGPFTFQGITSLTENPTVLSSTAVGITAANMTNSTIDCIAGNTLNSPSVGNISLCIVAPPTSIVCRPHSSSELSVTWEPVIDTSSCARSGVNYNVTLTKDSDMMSFSSLVPIRENRADLAGTTGLDPSARYLITVGFDLPDGTCTSTQVNVTCDTPPSTQPTESPTSPTTMSAPVTSSQSTSTPPPRSTTSQPSPGGLSTGIIAAIAVVVIVLVILVIVIVIVVVIILMMSSKGKKNGRGGVHAPLATDPEHDSLSGQQQAPVYAMVDKSKKTANLEQPTYQDPATIQHETAESGDLYAVSEKKGKAAKPGPEVAELYSEVDKSNKNEEGLTYASIEVDAKNAKKKPGGQPQEPVLYSDIQLPH